jgi:glucan phosphoethanolaminetransferase (alkaline phosphatase superfamily)
MAFITPSNEKFVRTRRAIVFALAGLLIFYHLNTVYGHYLGDGSNALGAMADLQSFIRIAVILSLTLVVFNVRYGLLSMWVSITALVLTQFIDHYGPEPSAHTLARSGFSYLRGFIVPTIITLVIPSAAKTVKPVKPANTD